MSANILSANVLLPGKVEQVLSNDQYSDDLHTKIQTEVVHAFQAEIVQAEDDKPYFPCIATWKSIYHSMKNLRQTFFNAARVLPSRTVILERSWKTISSCFKEQHDIKASHTDVKQKNPISLVRERPLELSKSHNLGRYSLTNTGNSKRRTFFAYNTQNRDGAKEEANNLRQHLEALGFEIAEPLVDFGAEELLEELERFCKENAKTTSILVVVLLTHGSWGRVHDKDDRWIDINEIQEPITIIPHTIPKVLIIQACQGGSVQEHCKCTSYDSGPPRGRLGSSDIHIQDLDMAILMSTLWGRMSTRNFFISILCEVLKEATIKPLEFTDIFRRVCTIMTQRNRSNYFSTSLDHKQERETTSKLTSPTETNVDNHQHEATPNLCPPENTSFEDEFIQIPCMLTTLRKKLFFDHFCNDSAIT